MLLRKLFACSTYYVATFVCCLHFINNERKILFKFAYIYVELFVVTVSVAVWFTRYSIWAVIVLNYQPPRCARGASQLCAFQSLAINLSELTAFVLNCRLHKNKIIYFYSFRVYDCVLTFLNCFFKLCKLISVADCKGIMDVFMVFLCIVEWYG